MLLYIDGDAFPNLLKPIVTRAIDRLSIKTIVVSNKKISLNSSNSLITYLLVEQGADVADEKIVELVNEGDLVITADIPLANKIIDKKAHAIDHRGELYTTDNIKEYLAFRNLMQELRDSGEITKGPATFTQKDSQKFANQLNMFLQKHLWYTSQKFKGFKIILNEKTLIEQFQLFCETNKPKDMETAVNYFAVFGGLDVKIDMSKPLRTLIRRHILSSYDEIQEHIQKLTKNSTPYHKILTGIALGDRRINSAFKRAEIEYDEGINSIYELEELNIIQTETSMDFLTKNFEENEAADKLLFTAPFLRFWFAFVSPLYRGVSRGEFDESFERFDNYHNEFMQLIFEQLCHEFIKISFSNDAIEEIGRYWDEQKNEINLLAQTESGKIIIGSCKYTNSKMKKTELNILKEYCEELEITPDFVVLFSKSGFTNELKDEKGNGLKLYTVKSLKSLIL